MAVQEIQGLPSHPVSMSNGKRTLTFDTPADLADWMDTHPQWQGAGWYWVGPVVSAN